MSAVTEAEQREAYAGPTLAVNRFLVTRGPFGLRVACMEQEADGGPSHFRTAFYADPANIAALVELLSGMLAMSDIAPRETVKSH